MNIINYRNAALIVMIIINVVDIDDNVIMYVRYFDIDGKCSIPEAVNVKATYKKITNYLVHVLKGDEKHKIMQKILRIARFPEKKIWHVLKQKKNILSI